ncbi:MAG: DUF4123 domain-containing protein [Burkholderiales bacterium]|nr:DUF4123 domain-containing protein [Burkholderiales bacterium]
MLGQEALNALKQLLWTTPEDRVYALLDGASVPSLLDRLYAEPRPEFECLMHGELAPDMAEVAPYLVSVQRDGAFTDWLLTQGWGNHWGIFAVARTDIRPLWFHLRTLNVVYGPEGKPMLFRYYDPRVLRVFLPTCSPQQVKEMFGPVASFVAEADAPSMALSFAHVDGELQTSSRQVARAA